MQRYVIKICRALLALAQKKLYTCNTLCNMCDKKNTFLFRGCETIGILWRDTGAEKSGNVLRPEVADKADLKRIKKKKEQR